MLLPSIAQVQAIKPSMLPGPFPPPGQQHLYTGYDCQVLYWFGYEVQRWELWVKINTDTNTWNIKWKTGTWPNTPLMYCLFLSYVKIWDDEGYYRKWEQIGYSGEATIIEYQNTNTWAYTEVRWAYLMGPPGIFDYWTCNVGLYVGN